MRRVTLLCAFLATVASASSAQLLDRLSFHIDPLFAFPVATSRDYYDYGIGGSLSACMKLGLGFSVYADAAYSLVANPSDYDTSLLSGGLGLGYSFFPFDRLGIGVFAGGGPYVAAWGGQSGWSWASARGCPRPAFRAARSRSSPSSSNPFSPYSIRTTTGIPSAPCPSATLRTEPYAMSASRSS